jgi:hydrogenase maturation protease
MTGSDRPLMLIAAVGNSDRGDDGFGPAVARLLHGRFPATVRILARSGDGLALIEDWRGIPFVIVIDAVAASTQWGRIYRLDLTDNPLPVRYPPRSSHAFGVAEAIELARRLDRLPRRLVAYLVEVEQFGTGAPLSPAVAGVVETVAERVVLELSTLLGYQSD